MNPEIWHCVRGLSCRSTKTVAAAVNRFPAIVSRLIPGLTVTVRTVPRAYRQQIDDAFDNPTIVDVVGAISEEISVPGQRRLLLVCCGNDHPLAGKVRTNNPLALWGGTIRATRNRLPYQ